MFFLAQMYFNCITKYVLLKKFIYTYSLFNTFYTQFIKHPPRKPNTNSRPNLFTIHNSCLFRNSLRWFVLVLVFCSVVKMSVRSRSHSCEHSDCIRFLCYSAQCSLYSCLCVVDHQHIKQHMFRYTHSKDIMKTEMDCWCGGGVELKGLCMLRVCVFCIYNMFVGNRRTWTWWWKLICCVRMSVCAVLI